MDVLGAASILASLGFIVVGVCHKILVGSSCASFMGREILAGPEADNMSNSLWNFSDITAASL